jgi:hypothetical protein
MHITKLGTFSELKNEEKAQQRFSIKMKPSFFLFLTFILTLSLFSSAWAVAIGASPATLSFELPRGGSEEKTFQVSTNSEAGLLFTLTKSAEISKFVTLSSSTSQTKLNNPAEITLKVSVPRTTTPGTYNGTVSVATTGTGEISSGTGSVIATGVAVKVSIKVTSESAPWFKTSETKINSNAVTSSATELATTGTANLGTILFIIFVISLTGGAVLLALRR